MFLKAFPAHFISSCLFSLRLHIPDGATSTQPLFPVKIGERQFSVPKEMQPGPTHEAQSQRPGETRPVVDEEQHRCQKEAGLPQERKGHGHQIKPMLLGHPVPFLFGQRPLEMPPYPERPRF